MRDQISKQGGKLLTKGRQLNHYFVLSDASNLEQKLEPYISESKKDLFRKIINEGKDLSVRTRNTDGEVKFVIKASIGDDTSSNGVSRMEFEDNISMTLDELDKLLLGAGLQYQAKWSREREEYKLKDVNICLDRNAGYGYLAEFEKVVPDQSLVDSVKRELIEIMNSFNVAELKQDRLERMFEYYNNNWRDYYGTEKIFNIE